MGSLTVELAKEDLKEIADAVHAYIEEAAGERAWDLSDSVYCPSLQTHTFERLQGLEVKCLWMLLPS